MLRLKKLSLLILIVLSVSQVLNVSGIGTNVYADEGFICGDVNGDGKVNSIDFAYMRQHILGFITEFPSINGLRAADVDGNAMFNSIDFAYMRQYLLQAIPDFPANLIPLAADPGEDVVTYKSFKVSLDGSFSTAPAGKIISYNWRIISKPSDSFAALDDSSAVSPSFVADLTGDYVLGLTVSDGSSTSDEEIVNVKAKEIGSKTDDLDTSCIPTGYIEGYDFNDYIPLSDGWIIVKDLDLNKVIFMNVFTFEHGKEFLVNGKPDKMEYDFDSELLFVSLSDTNMIAKINMKTEEITYIKLNESIMEMTLGERGIVFVITGDSYNGTIYVVDSVKDTVISSIEENEGYRLMAYDRYKNNLIVGVKGVSPSALGRYSFNEITNELEFQQYSRDLGSNGQDLAISSDGKHVAFCCGGGNDGYTIFDIDSSDITQKFGQWNTGAYPSSAHFTLDNKYIVASNASDLKIFDVETHEVISTVGRTASMDYSDDIVRFSIGGKIVFDTSEGMMCFYRSGIIQTEVIRPTAYTTGDKAALKGLSVNLDGTGSDMGSGTYLGYKWEMVSKPENSQSVINGARSSNPSFTPDMTGQYSVSLSVYNEAGESDLTFVNIIATDMMDTTDEIGDIEDGYLDGYLSIKPIALSNGWIIAADTKNVIKIVNVLTGDVASQYQVFGAPNKLSYDSENNRIIASFTAVNKIAVIDIGKNSLYYIDTPYSYKGIVYGEKNIAFAISDAWPSGYISVIDIEKKQF